MPFFYPDLQLFANFVAPKFSLFFAKASRNFTMESLYFGYTVMFHLCGFASEYDCVHLCGLKTGVRRDRYM
jgi:hypothetical protein